MTLFSLCWTLMYVVVASILAYFNITTSISALAPSTLVSASTYCAVERIASAAATRLMIPPIVTTTFLPPLI